MPKGTKRSETADDGDMSPGCGVVAEDQAPGGAGVVTYRTFEIPEDMANNFYPMGWYFQRDDDFRLGRVYGPYEAQWAAREAAEDRP
jgi:hypothetical protein